MKNLVTIFSACLIALASGCAMQTTDERSVAVSGQALTIAECNDLQNECIDDIPTFLGLTLDAFAVGECNTELALCVSDAQAGVPAEVAEAVGGALDCAAAFDSCALAVPAGDAAAAVACFEDEANCVAGVLEIELPTIVGGTTGCVDDAVTCINDATDVSDLGGCGDGLGECAIDEANQVVADATDLVDDVLPTDVAATVDAVTDCTDDFTACALAAQPGTGDAAACVAAQAECVSGSLGVDLPDVPVTDVLECTDNATDCILASETLEDIGECVDSLVACGEEVVAAIDAPPVVNCASQFNQCLVSNPFRFFMCAQEQRACINQ